MVRLCHLYGITPLHELVDEAIAASIEETEACYRRVFDAQRPSFIDVASHERLFKIVRRIETVKSEDAMASFLVLATKTNEEWLKEQVARRRTVSTTKWEKYFGFFLRFIDDMNEAKRYRFCSFYAQLLVKAKLDASVFCTRDSLSKSISKGPSHHPKENDPFSLASLFEEK